MLYIVDLFSYRVNKFYRKSKTFFFVREKFLILSFSPQTSQINSGTSVDPNFDPLRQILKFPFLHLLDNGERVSPCHFYASVVIM